MPSRNYGSSDGPPSSPRSSLRRFSSLASFQNLNPFNRRRSNNATDNTIASSSSVLSLSSTNYSQHPCNTSAGATSSFFCETQEGHTETPAESQQPVSCRRGSYIRLPDEPATSLPRSRTFSNLPLPTRARKGRPMALSKSYSRLPSTTTVTAFVQQPPFSSNVTNISASRLGSYELKQPVAINRMRRSETQPLLPVNAERLNIRPRQTAFKENLSMSPVKHALPVTLSDGSKSPLIKRRPVNILNDTETAALWEARTTASGVRGWPSVGHIEPLNKWDSSKAASSPIRQFRENGPVLPHENIPQPVQKWKSQPILTNMTDFRTSQQYEIKQSRLLSERQPPIPSLQRSASTDQPNTPGRSKGTIAARVIDIACDLSPTKQHRAQRRTALPIENSAEALQDDPLRQHAPGQVFTAEPSAYWCGRFSSLVDRYRNEELVERLGAIKAESDKMHEEEANTKRMRRVLEHLHSLCITPEARDSLITFQLQLATLHKTSDLSFPIQLGVPDIKTERQVSDASHASTAGSGVSLSEARKFGFMDRLFGRSRRSFGSTLT